MERSRSSLASRRRRTAPRLRQSRRCCREGPVAVDHLTALDLVVGSAAKPKRQRKRVSIPDVVAPNTKLRLEAAARIAFPDGSISVSALRRESAAARLTIYRIAGKDFTTLADIEEMKTT